VATRHPEERRQHHRAVAADAVAPRHRLPAEHHQLQVLRVLQLDVERVVHVQEGRPAREEGGARFVDRVHLDGAVDVSGVDPRRLEVLGAVKVQAHQSGDVLAALGLLREAVVAEGVDVQLRAVEFRASALHLLASSPLHLGGAVLSRFGHELRGVPVTEVAAFTGRLGAAVALLLAEAVLRGHAAVQVVARDHVAAGLPAPGRRRRCG